MFKSFFKSIFAIGHILVLLFSLNAQASLFDNSPFATNDGPLDVEQAFVMGHSQTGNKLTLFWDIPADYYLYRDRIELKHGDQIQVIERINAPSKPKDDPLFGKVQVYYERAEVSFELGSKTSAAVDDTVSVTYQGCWEGGICYPPVTKQVPVTAIEQATALPVSTTAANTSSNTSTPVLLSEQDRFAQTLSQGNTLVIIAAFFVAGLALSFTPCVFPMIPILSSIIAGQGSNVTAKKGFVLSLVYVLAVSVTYTIAGVLAGLFGENLQATFQNPWIISVFSLVFVLLSLSMFGFYDLQLPSGLQTRLSNITNSQKGGTYTGVAIMGFLSALIVGPCMAAPLAGALIYIGQTGDPVIGGTALFAMSLGMGVPILVVGTSAGKFLPKAGTWMDKVKAVFGVLLLLLAVWMLDRIVPTAVTMWLAAVILVVSAVYMGALTRVLPESPSRVLLVKGLGVVVLVYAVSLMLGALAGNKSLLYPLKGIGGGGVGVQQTAELPFVKVTTPEQLQTELDKARNEGKPVMLDFYADWCVACIELEVFTFADVGVQRALDRFHLVKVDVTANDEPAKALNRAYSIIGPPALIFFTDQGAKLEHKTLIGVVKPSDFIAHIGDI